MSVHAAAIEIVPHAAAPAAGEAVVPARRICVECGEKFDPPAKGPGQHKKFCKDACRFGFANREKSRGAALVTIAQVYAMKRHARPSTKDAELRADCWAEFTRILNTFNEEDRRTGRAERLPTYVRTILNIDTNYHERRRRS